MLGGRRCWAGPGGAPWCWAEAEPRLTSDLRKRSQAPGERREGPAGPARPRELGQPLGRGDRLTHGLPWVTAGRAGPSDPRFHHLHSQGPDPCRRGCLTSGERITAAPGEGKGVHRGHTSCRDAPKPQCLTPGPGELLLPNPNRVPFAGSRLPDHPAGPALGLPQKELGGHWGRGHAGPEEAPESPRGVASLGQEPRLSDLPSPTAWGPPTGFASVSLWEQTWEADGAQRRYQFLQISDPHVPGAHTSFLWSRAATPHLRFRHRRPPGVIAPRPRPLAPARQPRTLPAHGRPPGSPAARSKLLQDGWATRAPRTPLAPLISRGPSPGRGAGLTGGPQRGRGGRPGHLHSSELIKQRAGAATSLCAANCPNGGPTSRELGRKRDAPHPLGFGFLGQSAHTGRPEDGGFKQLRGEEPGGSPGPRPLVKGPCPESNRGAGAEPSLLSRHGVPSKTPPTRH